MRRVGSLPASRGAARPVRSAGLVPVPSSALVASLLAALLASLVAGCALAPTSDPRAEVRGPIASRDLHPLSLTVLSFRPRRAATQPAGEWRLTAAAAYASIEEVNAQDGDSVAFDGELLRTELRARYGLSERFDVEVELPFLYTTSGFLDSFVESFHSALGLPDGGRDLEENDQFDMQLVSDGEPIYSVDEDRFGIQDVPIHLTGVLRAEDRAGPGVAARVGLELPTGDEEAGFGNGAVDWGLGVVSERSFGRWTVFGGAAYTFSGQPDAFEAAGVELEDLLSLQLGGEFRWSNRLSLLLQTTWTSRLVQDVPLEEIDREIFDLGLGFALDTGERSRLTFSLHEDLVSASGPDLTALLSWSVDL